ncbi:carbohydrate ABC transporter substrate-binding protein, CUT1 family, partial [Haematococcus lacustris]
MTGDTTAASSLYDLVMFSSSMMGDLGIAGALADLRPWILADTEQGLSWSDLGPYDNTASPMYQQQVVGVPWTETPFLMYVNWPLLSSVYNIRRPAQTEVGRLPFYPDTWQELLAVMRRVNATASDPVTSKPRHALCMRYNSDTSYLLHAVMASMMQTQGYSQGYIYDPLTLQPLTNTTAMQQALRIVWELTSFVRGFDTAVDSIDMAQCAIALSGASVFQSLNPVHSNAQFMGQLAMSPLPASTEVLDRSTMQLVPCTAQLCNSQRSSQLGGQLANLSPSRYQPSLFLGMSATVPRQMQSAVFNFMAGVSGPNMTKVGKKALR